jgi:hypothetical protein
MRVQGSDSGFLLSICDFRFVISMFHYSFLRFFVIALIKII